MTSNAQDNSIMNIDSRNTGTQTADDGTFSAGSAEMPLLEVQGVTRSFGLGTETVEILLQFGIVKSVTGSYRNRS